jgi:iron complex outermembrane receptor protein
MVIQRVCFCLCLMLVVPAHAESELSEADFLAEMPTVLTASRLSQPLMDAPNSTNVIDRKQIEASGYRNLADLFRLVPGMYVGHKKGWFHNVTHTFTDEYARRMQVMVDGRSVYLPSIGGVRWDTLPLGGHRAHRSGARTQCRQLWRQRLYRHHQYHHPASGRCCRPHAASWRWRSWPA